MNFDDLLKAAWHSERQSASQRELTRRVVRQRMRLRVRRGIELALTAAALLVFGRSLLSQSMGPAHWLTLPFFALYIPIAWAIILRAPRRRAWDASERADVYARRRLSQLRASLRDLRFAGAAAGVLFVYAVAANAVVWWLADDRWREAGVILLIAAGACLLATWALIVLSRRRVLLEYRAVRRLVGT